MERVGASHWATAVLANAVLQDYGLITPNNKDFVINQSKIERELETWHKVVSEMTLDDIEVRSVYFDGRKDETLVAVQEGSKRYPRKNAKKTLQS